MAQHYSKIYKTILKLRVSRPKLHWTVCMKKSFSTLTFSKNAIILPIQNTKIISSSFAKNTVNLSILPLYIKKTTQMSDLFLMQLIWLKKYYIRKQL